MRRRRRGPEYAREFHFRPSVAQKNSQCCSAGQKFLFAQEPSLYAQSGKFWIDLRVSSGGFGVQKYFWDGAADFISFPVNEGGIGNLSFPPSPRKSGD